MVAEMALLDSFIDFLINRPTPEEIMNFKATTHQNERLEFLLQKNREATLTDEEEREIQYSLKANHYVTMAKIRAYGELRAQQ